MPTMERKPWIIIHVLATTLLFRPYKVETSDIRGGPCVHLNLRDKIMRSSLEFPKVESPLQECYLQQYSSSIWGTNNYVEYQPGSPTSKIIMLIPHGGYEMPQNIPKRVNGCRINGRCVYSHNCTVGDPTDCSAGWTGSDEYTVKLGNAFADSIHNITGDRPHVIVSHLYRDRLDANRPRNIATFQDHNALTAWYEFHDFVKRAKATVGRGLLIDIHAHGRHNNWIQLGYTLSGDDLGSKRILDASKSSVYYKSSQIDIPFEEFIRGDESLGGFLERDGFISVPGPGLPSPGAEHYLAGGYNTKRHGSQKYGTIDAIQIEFPQYIRRYWEQHAHSVAESFVKYTKRWYS